MNNPPIPVKPKDATHHWKGAELEDKPFWWLQLLGYYKQVEGKWYVWSDMTSSYRISGNPAEWFEEQTKLGMFVEVEDD